MQIVALSGFARSGKDETAKVLVEQYGFKQIAFADKLRDFLYALNPRVMAEYEGQGKPHSAVSDVKTVIDNNGWQGYKETMWSNEIRVLLQRLGTEAGRQTLWDTIWIDAALTGLDANAKVVVSDARFFNEFDAVRARGGEVWRINRPGVGPANSHASEMEAIDYTFDRTINNSQDLNYLRSMVHLCYTDFVKLKAPVVEAAPAKGGLNSRPPGGRPANIPPGVTTSYDVPKKR